MSGHTMNQAARSEARFIMIASEEGWEIAKPFHHAQGYDFVIRRSLSRIWETVQVKTAFLVKRKGNKKDYLAVSLRRCNEKGARGYVDGEFEILFVVHEDSCWFIPWEIVQGTKSTISVSSSRYGRFKVR